MFHSSFKGNQDLFIMVSLNVENTEANPPSNLHVIFYFKLSTDATIHIIGEHLSSFCIENIAGLYIPAIFSMQNDDK